MHRRGFLTASLLTLTLPATMARAAPAPVVSGIVYVPGLLLLPAGRRAVGRTGAPAWRHRSGLARRLLEQPGLARPLCEPRMDRPAKNLRETFGQRGLHARPGGKRRGDGGWIRQSRCPPGHRRGHPVAGRRHAAPHRIGSGGGDRRDLHAGRRDADNLRLRNNRLRSTLERTRAANFVEYRVVRDVIALDAVTTRLTLPLPPAGRGAVLLLQDTSWRVAGAADLLPGQES